MIIKRKTSNMKLIHIGSLFIIKLLNHIHLKECVNSKLK